MAFVLFLGAGSDIAMALEREYARAGFDLYLAGRNGEEMGRLAPDLEVRFRVRAVPLVFDVMDTASHEAFYRRLEPKPIGVVCAVGYLGDQGKGQEDFAEARKIIETNFVGCVSILEVVAGDMEKRREGFIVGISSVAGDRGRAANYLYGSAKAGFTAFQSGLRGRLHPSGVQVLTVKPGFVRTKMTEHMDLPGLLTAEPEEVARTIWRAQRAGKRSIYTKGLWRIIMAGIRHLPENLFLKMK
jgi:decaprenylphospho-beta-D-erythro-pentofuranosid-2-ulose 2-reductase